MTPPSSPNGDREETCAASEEYADADGDGHLVSWNVFIFQGGLVGAVETQGIGIGWPRDQKFGPGVGFQKHM